MIKKPYATPAQILRPPTSYTTEGRGLSPLPASGCLAVAVTRTAYARRQESISNKINGYTTSGILVSHSGVSTMQTAIAQKDLTYANRTVSFDGGGEN